MIKFLPERPETFTPFFWLSKAATKAADAGYYRYCEIYFEGIGRSLSTDNMVRHKSLVDAKDMALHGGMYAQVVNLQSHCEQVERMEALK